MRAPIKINACLAGGPGGHVYVLYILPTHTVGLTLTRDDARRLGADLLSWSDGEMRSEILKGTHAVIATTATAVDPMPGPDQR
jgi:hypothetical protein